MSGSAIQIIDVRDAGQGSENHERLMLKFWESTAIHQKNSCAGLPVTASAATLPVGCEPEVPAPLSGSLPGSRQTLSRCLEPPVHH